MNITAAVATTSPSLGAALLLGLVASPASETVKLQFAPAVGTTVEHEIKISSQVEGGDLSVLMGGNEVPAQFLPKLSVAIQTSTAATFTDEFLEVKEGIEGPWRKRTVSATEGTFSMEMGMDDESFEFSSEATSDLDGSTFLIGRDEDGDKVVRWAAEDSELSTEPLDLQRPEIDLAGLLSEDAVSVDDTWEADAGALADVLDISRTLPWTWSGAGSEQIPAPGVAEWQGDLELRVTEMTKVDDDVHCVISFTGEAVETVTRPGDLSQVPVAEGTATETTATNFQVKGEITWSATAGHLVAFELEAEGEGEQVTKKDDGQPGPSYESTTHYTTQLSVELD